jgi:pimeloyl-ACP methyl ester carboxylesterase
MTPLSPSLSAQNGRPNEPKLQFIERGTAAAPRRLAYWDWGQPTPESGQAGPEHLLLCVHGLTRQGRDFEHLARALSPLMRVVAVDVAGRGQSDPLSNPADYQVATYAADMAALLAELKPKTLDWLGTSMGGLIGMAFAGTPALQVVHPVRRLILNDIGPSLEFAALQRIGQYTGRPLHFADLQAGAEYLWSVSSSFGPHTPSQWMALSRHMFKADGEGLKLHYDPAIGVAFQGLTPESTLAGEAALWQLYEGIQAQTLVLRGAESDLLSRATVQAMSQRGPRAACVEFAGVGHAPTFMTEDQVQVVKDFLLKDFSIRDV